MAVLPATLSGRWGFITSRQWLARSILYVLFFAVALVAFIYIRFPAARLTPIVNETLREAPFHVEAGDIQLAFPPGLRLNSVTVAEKSDPKSLIVTVPRLTIKPSIISAILGRAKADISAELLGGGVSASADSGEKEVEISMEFDGIDPGQGEWWGRFPWFKAQGLISGKGRMEMKMRDLPAGEGTMKAELAEGSITLNKSLNPSGASIIIDKGELELKMAKGVISVAKGSFTGPDINIQISGNVGVSQNFPDSRLNIVAAIFLSPSMKEKLGMVASMLPAANHEGKHVIRLGGSLAQPQMK
ncbi:MAG: type II secretion system protein GspN [Nitrospinota bacterium]|nr:type II secretion system protein GspN [Nitrospinota bacterium]